MTVFEYNGSARLTLVDADGVCRTHEPSNYTLVDMPPAAVTALGLPVTAGFSGSFDFALDGSWALA